MRGLPCESCKGSDLMGSSGPGWAGYAAGPNGSFQSPDRTVKPRRQPGSIESQVTQRITSQIHDFRYILALVKSSVILPRNPAGLTPSHKGDVKKN